MNIAEVLDAAYAHWNSGHSKGAEQLCRRVVRTCPDQPDALNLLGLIAYSRGEATRAASLLEHACRSPEAPAAFHTNLAEICRRLGRLAAAEQAGRRAVEVDGSLPQAWNNLGIILYDARKLEESRAALERAVELAPESAAASNNLGNTLWQLRALPQACERYRRAVELDSEFAQAHSNLAAVLEEMGRHKEALVEAERAIEIDPRLLEAYLAAAAAEAALGRRDAAGARIRSALMFAPGDARLLGARAALE
jgi:tetratricopeptide (TPR) repeat protein